MIIALEEAKLEAKKIIDEASAEALKIQSQISELKSSMDMYRGRAIGMLNAQIEVINKFDAE